MADDTHQETDGRMLHRMVFFTDAVFAIVLTLLVLELKPPETHHEATLETLRHALPHIGAFVFSFVIIGIFWAAHMNTTRRLATFDWPVALANLAYLLPICLLPYVTAWLGADIQGATTWVFYSSVLIAISASNIVLVLLAFRDGGRLIDGPLEPNERLLRVARAGTPGLAFLLGLAAVAAGEVILAHFCSLLIPFIFRLSRWLLQPRPAKAKAKAAPDAA